MNTPDYSTRVVFDASTEAGAEMMRQACELFERMPYPSIATIERELKPGFSISAAIMAELQKRGIVSAPHGNGEREYFGRGKAGRAAFLAFAEKLKAGTEPAAHWWQHLPESSRRKYLPGADGLAWGDLSDADKGRARIRYWKNLDAFRALQAQFIHARAAA